ncbi:MAG: hypothetical protein RMI94_13720 [Bryobacterales bacterium]|nr:hypothetical protein [Bryobacterales bacterium]
MDEKLKALMQELGNAINESLSESEQIAAAIAEIRRAGYDVFLILEATIGFNRREAEPEPGRAPTSGSEGRRARETEPAPRIKWTSQDQKFLRALKIAIEDD